MLLVMMIMMIHSGLYENSSCLNNRHPCFNPSMHPHSPAPTNHPYYQPYPSSHYITCILKNTFIYSQHNTQNQTRKNDYIFCSENIYSQSLSSTQPKPVLHFVKKWQTGNRFCNCCHCCIHCCSFTTTQLPFYILLFF